MSNQFNFEQSMAGNQLEFKSPSIPIIRAVNKTTDQLDGFSDKLEPRRDSNSPFEERVDGWHSEIGGF